MEKRTIISSLAFKFVERLLVKVLGLVISIILARLIAPDDFGQLAILTVFINLSQTIIQGGLNTALVQSKSVDERDYSTVFYISAFVSVLLIIALFIGAPYISAYYDTETLVNPLRFYAFTLLFGAFNSVQLAKLQREMKFKATMYASLIATVLSGVIGVAMAYWGFGIWALVVYNTSCVVISCITMLFSAKWLPKLMFSWKRAKQLFSFGWKMLVSAMLCSVYVDVRTLLVGKYFSTEDLAYYNRGQQFPSTISNTLDTAIQSVMFPAFASCQDDIERVKMMLKRSLSLGTFLIVPVMVGLAVTSEAVVKLLLTDKWLPCVLYMQILCLADASIPLTSSNLVAIKAIGRSDVYMKLEIVRRLAMLAVLMISVLCFHTVEAIVVGYLVSSWLDYVIILIPTKRLLKYGIGEQLKDIWKTLFASACVAVAAYSVSFLGLQILAELIMQVFVGVATYIVLCMILKIESFSYLKDFVLGKAKHH